MPLINLERVLVKSTTACMCRGNEILGAPGDFGEYGLPPFSQLRDFSFQNTSEHFAIRFRQSYLIWEVCDVTAIELSSKE